MRTFPKDEIFLLSQTSSGVLGATLDLRDAMQSLFDTHKDQIEHATTEADIERIVNAGKIAAFLTVEGGHTIDDDLRVMRMYYQLGIRSMTLTHSRNNDWADSATDEPAHNGLTDEPAGNGSRRFVRRRQYVLDALEVTDQAGDSYKGRHGSSATCRRTA